MRLGIVSVLAAMLLLVSATCSFAFWIDFEQGLGNDGGAIAGDYVGIYFTNSAGMPWIYGDSNTGHYNTHSVDLGLSWNNDLYNHYGYCWAWLGTGQPWGRVDFTSQDGTYFQVRYCAGGGTGLTLEAYDWNGNLLASAWGPDNVRPSVQDMGSLAVTAPSSTTIAYVLIHDSGNLFLIDNIQGNFSGVTPVSSKTWGAIKGMFR